MPSFLRKHLGAAKRKIRDTVIETKTICKPDNQKTKDNR